MYIFVFLIYRLTLSIIIWIVFVVRR